MKLQKKILVDRIIGYPIVIFLNFFSKLLGKVLNRDHSFDKENVNTVIVCKLMGLGSVIQSTPLVSSIKSHYCNSKIVYITKQENSPICDRISAINQTICVDDRSVFQLLKTTISLLVTVWRLKPDIFINLEVHSMIGSIYTVLSCARNRLGFYTNSGDMRATGIYTQMSFFNPKAPRLQIYLQMARTVNIENISAKLLPINIEREKTQILFKKIEKIDNYIIINPNTSELGKERRWSKKNFIELSNRIIDSYEEYKIYFIGSPSEYNYVISIVDNISNDQVINLSGSLDLVEASALINGAKLLITNDSGPMHIGFSLNTTTLSLFGPTSPYHYITNKDNGKHAYVYKELYCSPCVHHFDVPPCRGNNQCMKLISVNEVFELTKDILDKNTITSKSNTNILYGSANTVHGIVRRHIK